ncbi:unnamed protein product [Amoebophrya sp. A120]|nr:unnamed protein product [Amoebophrya sp. A120]|eukprot:GSA120T00007638001.1
MPEESASHTASSRTLSEAILKTASKQNASTSTTTMAPLQEGQQGETSAFSSPTSTPAQPPRSNAGGRTPSSSSTSRAGAALLPNPWRGRMVQTQHDGNKWGLVVLEDEDNDTLHVQIGYVSLCSARTPPASPSRRPSKENSRRSSRSRAGSAGGGNGTPTAVSKSSRRPSEDQTDTIFNEPTAGEKEEVVLVSKKKILNSSYAPLGVCLYTKVGIGVLVGFRPENDCHILRLPHSSTTAYLQRDQLVGISPACPELPVTTPYGVGICVRKSESYDTWTIKLNHHEHGGTAYLKADKINCDARFVPLVEAGKRKWKRKQWKTYTLLAKLQKVAQESGVIEKITTAYEESSAEFSSVYDTAKKAWDTTVDVVEKEVVLPTIGETLTGGSPTTSPGKDSEVVDKSAAAPDGNVDNQDPLVASTSKSPSPPESGEENAFKTPPIDDNELQSAEESSPEENDDGTIVDGQFADAQQGDEEFVKAQKYVEEEADRLKKLAETKLEEHADIVQEVYSQIDKLEHQKEKMLETMAEFGEKAALEIGKDEDVKEVVKLVEQAKDEAAQVLASELEKGAKVYESSKMANLVNETSKRLQEKLDKLSAISGQKLEEISTTPEANQQGQQLNKGLQDFMDRIAQKNAVWQAKGTALFGSVQRRYLAGPDGWIAKTRKKLQLVLKEDQLGLKQWDFTTYTNSFQKQANELNTEVTESAFGEQKERAKFTKKAVNSAAEQLVAIAKPDESAAELLAKLDRMRGMDMLEAIDLQGILDKAGIHVPSYVATYFQEDNTPASTTSQNDDDFKFDVSTLTNAKGEKVLQKVLDDQNLVGKAQEMVGHVEGVLDKVSDLAQNKTVQSLLQNVIGTSNQTEQQIATYGTDMGETLMQKLETIDVDEALEMTEKTLADLQDPVKRAQMVDNLVDSAVDGLMSLLPKIHIDNMEGQSHDFSYLVGNIDLGGFKLRKECVNVKINFETATTENLQEGFELVSLHAWNMSCILEKVHFSFEQQNFPYLNGEGIAKCFASDISLRLGFSVRWKNGAPQLYMSRRMVDIDFLTMEIEESWFSALYNVLISAFSNLIRNYVNDKIEDQIDQNVGLLTGSLDTLLTYDAVKPWLASLAPRDKDGKILPEVIPVNDPSKEGAADKNRLPLSSERRALAEAKKKEQEELRKKQKKLGSPKQGALSPSRKIDPNAYYQFKPEGRTVGFSAGSGANNSGPNFSGQQQAQERRSEQESLSDLASALAQMTVMRSMLKSLKTGKPVTKGQVQQVLFSALFAVEDEAVKQCLSEIHEMLTRVNNKTSSSSSKQPSASSTSGSSTTADGASSKDAAGGGLFGRVGGFVKSAVSTASAAVTSASSPQPQNATAASMQEVISGDERKQLIFALGLALSLPKFQQPTLQVREMNKKCLRNRKEQDPNKLIPLSELRELTILWSDFNRKMMEDLNALKEKATEEVDLIVVKSAKFKTVVGNLNICQDALLKIKMDLTKSSQLRDRRQLETIILHLLDAIRCHTDGSDLLHELTDERQRQRRSRGRTGSAGSQSSMTSQASTPAGGGSPVVGGMGGKDHHMLPGAAGGKK